MRCAFPSFSLLCCQKKNFSTNTQKGFDVLCSSHRYASYFEGDIAWPEATDYMGGRYVGTTVEIEQLRPKSPPKFGGGDRSNN
ncbi:n6-adenosine-methyltransferase [Cystoisospora suis]|uniref:N6-adenosine-methyltransferase n=1 Tax=Cystoisospora suis TaxID=483139 RepID=A0A2C6KGF7_9APIC|nr:n6-adenosine-methyltransferase [Cystoisospora suis]